MIGVFNNDWMKFCYYIISYLLSMCWYGRVKPFSVSIAIILPISVYFVLAMKYLWIQNWYTRFQNHKFQIPKNFNFISQTMHFPHMSIIAWSLPEIRWAVFAWIWGFTCMNSTMVLHSRVCVIKFK